MNQRTPAPNVMLLGGIGTGKTFSVGTLLAKNNSSSWKKQDSYITEVFHLFTEPSMETLAELSCADGYHYAYVPAATPSWDEMIRSAREINTLSLKALAKKEGMNKQDYGQLMILFGILHDFKCDRCKKSFGDVSTWENTRALVVDSLSGINIMAMDLVVGSKPVKSMSDWGIAMDRVSRLVNKLCADTMCWMILSGHIEIERDEVTGRMQGMPSTLGRKLAPVLPRYFSEVIECVKEGSTFTWSTENADVNTKTRNLPMSGKLQPDFQQLIQSWRKKHEDSSM